jgi:hypothetical protein
MYGTTWFFIPEAGDVNAFVLFGYVTFLNFSAAYFTGN